ncbi:M16 family metallopeptidase [Pannonibacter indicus]|uniref:M16 family metallopeptidase n=1 Tax=Pannonibacter indicus TaxID=466044 RepID=UPI0035B2361A
MTQFFAPARFARAHFTRAVAGIGLLMLGALPAGATTIEKVVSPGGIEAWLVQDETLPMISMNFAFDGGSAQDPDGKEGLANLLASTMDEGAGDLDSEAFQGKLEELAVSIRFNSGKDQLFGTLRTLTGTQDEAFDLLRLAINEPRFDEKAVERVKSQILAGLRQQQEDPDAIASEAFRNAAFGGHPYGKPGDGTVETVEKLAPADLESMHGDLLSRHKLAIGVVGAIDAKTLAPLLDEVFGKLPEKHKLPEVADVEPKTGERISRTLDVPQTTILIGLPGLKRDDPDYQAAFVMNHILGGGTFTSWLFEEVREKRGLSYGVGSDLAPDDHSALLVASAATRADRADETISIIEEQFKRMAEQGPTQEELDKAKSFLTGSYALRFDTSGKIAAQLVALKLADLGIDYFDRRNAEIEAVTLEDVQRIAKRLLEGKTPLIVTVGPQAS